MAGHNEGEQLLVSCMDRWSLRHSLRSKRRFIWQSMLNGLYETKSSMLVDWRLVLRRVVTVIDVDPSIVASKGILELLMAIVVLMVHADLSHYGIVHSLDECSVPVFLCDSNCDGRLLARTGKATASTSTVFLAKAVQSLKTADCMHDKHWSLVNPASPTAAALKLLEVSGKRNEG
jgi:hypothetical protein